MSGHVDRSNISNPPQEYLIPPNLAFLTMICFTFLELLKWPPFLNSQCPTQKMDLATYHRRASFPCQSSCGGALLISKIYCSGSFGGRLTSDPYSFRA